MADEPDELEVRTRERLQQAAMNRALQAYGGRASALVMAQELHRAELHQARGFAHPGGHELDRALEDGDVADELTGPRHGDAPLEGPGRKHHFRGAPQHE